MSATNGNGVHANGTSAPPLTDGDVRPALRRQLREALVAGKFKLARAIQESLFWWDDFGGSDLFDRVRPSSNDGPGWVSLAPPSIPSDRRHGQRWPVFRTIQELDLLRQEARLRIAGNSYAQGLLRNLTNNVIGKGYAYTVVPISFKDRPHLNDRGQGSEDEEALADKVQDKVDEFLRLNNWNGGAHPDTTGVVVATREREIYRRVRGEDGEAFLRFHFKEDGTTIIRFIEPEQIRDLGGLIQDGWLFGIRHKMKPFEDVETPEIYRVHWPDMSARGGEGDDRDGGMYEDLEAREVLHIKGPDTPSTVKRGLSPFLFDAGRALDRASKLQRNASLGAAYRAATGEVWKHLVGTQSQLSSLVSGVSDGLTAVDPITGGLDTVERIKAPAVRRVPASQEPVDLPTDQSESYLKAGQGDLQQAGAAFCAPAYWFGDTGDVNYNNAESAAAPAVRDGQCEQEYFKAAFAAAIWRAIKWAVECGKLPENVEDKVKIDVEAPAVLHRNELEKAQEDQIGVTVGWKDPQTCAEERGLDWVTVQKRLQEHQQTMLDQQVKQAEAMQQFQPAPGEGGVGKPPGGPPGGGGGAPAGPPKPKPPAMPKAGGRMREAAEHDVSGEKRDEAGKWTTGGGGNDKTAKRDQYAFGHIKDYLQDHDTASTDELHEVMKDAGIHPRHFEAILDNLYDGGYLIAAPDEEHQLDPRHTGKVSESLAVDEACAVRAASRLLEEQADRERREGAGDHPGAHPEADDAAPLIADLLHHLFGDDALAQITGLRESWDAADHPRGAGGRFIKRGSEEAQSLAKKVVSDALKGQGDAATVAKHLALLDVKQLRKLHQQHGVEKIPSYITRAHLVAAVHDRLKMRTDRRSNDEKERQAKRDADRAAYAKRGAPARESLAVDEARAVRAASRLLEARADREERLLESRREPPAPPTTPDVTIDLSGFTVNMPEPAPAPAPPSAPAFTIINQIPEQQPAAPANVTIVNEAKEQPPAQPPNVTIVNQPPEIPVTVESHNHNTVNLPKQPPATVEVVQPEGGKKVTFTRDDDGNITGARIKPEPPKEK